MNFGGFNRAREQVSIFFSSNEIFHFSYKDIFHCLQLYVDRHLDFPPSFYWVFKKVWEINTSEVATAKSIWSYCFEKIIEAHSNWLWRRKVQKWNFQSFTKEALCLKLGRSTLMSITRMNSSCFFVLTTHSQLFILLQGWVVL